MHLCNTRTISSLSPARLSFSVRPDRTIGQERDQVADGGIAQGTGQAHRHDRVRTGTDLVDLLARYQRGMGVGIGNPDRVSPFGMDDPDDDLAALGRHGIRSKFRIDRGTGRRDGAVNLGAALLADLGQVGADLAPLPPERVALRAAGLLAAKDRLTASGVAAGEVGDDQGRRRRGARQWGPW